MLIHVIVPVVLIIGVGYLFGRYVKVDVASISKFSMVVLSPALIFSFLVRNRLTPGEMEEVVAAVLLFTAAMVLVTLAVMRLGGMKEFATPALLATVFPNTGNYGLPILLFAFGQEAFSLGVIVVVLNFILMYSLGVYFASLERNSWRTALAQMIRLPTTYATVAAVVVDLLTIPIPNFIYDPIKMMGDAMIPVAMLILGMQLAQTKLKGGTRPTVVSSLLRLIVSPVVMLAIVGLFGIRGLMAKVLIIQHAMPTAVIMTMIAAEYRARPDFVAGTTFLSTLLSFITIAAWLYGVNILFGA